MMLNRSGIATMLGTTPGMVDVWRHRHADFPAPVRRASNRPVWDEAEVWAWHQRSRPTGRPPKG